MIKIKGSYLALAAVLLLPMGASADVIAIGPGDELTGTELDTQDERGRINIDDVNFAPLEAGDYQATTFNFDAGSESSVTAFLAILTGTNIYEVIAVSALQNVNAGTDQSVVFGGSDLFSLGALTNVYAGIATFGAPNPIEFSGGGTTDHDNNLSLGSLAIGTTIDGLSHPNLGRQYNFDIEVVATSVPEPGTLALLGAGLLGMGAVRRRKKA